MIELRIVLIAGLGAGVLLLAGCGRAGRPELPEGVAKPQMVTPPNAVAVTKEVRPYGDNWAYPRRRGVFQIDPPPPEPARPKGSFFLDPLL